MAPRRALLYCTVNGVCNNTNGLGRQTKTLLSALDRHQADLVSRLGPFAVHLACPEPGPRTWGFDPADLAYARRVVAGWAGSVHPLTHDTAQPFWSVPVWKALCADAARLAERLAGSYDQLLVVGVDTPFAGLGAAVDVLPPSPVSERIQVVLAPYSTALIVERPSPSPPRVAWERAGVTAANTSPRTRVGDTGHFVTAHLRAEYGLAPDRSVPFRSSLDLTSPDLDPMPADAAHAVLRSWAVPTDRPVVLTVGRTDPTKGIDLLADALSPLADDVHAVLVAVPLPGDDHVVEEYRARASALGVRATVVGAFTRELPRALCSLPLTRVVACPSRGESLANVPFEVALWAREGGPVVVAPKRDGFVEQVDDGVTGLLYDPAARHGLTEAVRRGLDLSPRRQAAVRQAAAARVLRERDVVTNLAESLLSCWPSAQPPPPRRDAQEGHAESTRPG